MKKPQPWSHFWFLHGPKNRLGSAIVARDREFSSREMVVWKFWKDSLGKE